MGAAPPHDRCHHDVDGTPLDCCSAAGLAGLDGSVLSDEALGACALLSSPAKLPLPVLGALAVVLRRRWGPSGTSRVACHVCRTNKQFQVVQLHNVSDSTACAQGEARDHMLMEVAAALAG